MLVFGITAYYLYTASGTFLSDSNSNLPICLSFFQVFFPEWHCHIYYLMHHNLSKNLVCKVTVSMKPLISEQSTWLSSMKVEKQFIQSWKSDIFTPLPTKSIAKT